MFAKSLTSPPRLFAAMFLAISAAAMAVPASAQTPPPTAPAQPGQPGGRWRARRRPGRISRDSG